MNVHRLTMLVAVILVALTCSSRGDSATRLYEQGKYGEAFERFKKEAAKQPDNWPLLYNLGASAYKAGQPDEAAKAFERAIGSKDRSLQEQSFYNLGNSYYRIGEVAEQQAPPQALAFYEKSLKGFEGALALDPNDRDAKFNADLTKKKIEELKKQQEQQQQRSDKQEDNQDKDNKKENQQQQQSPESHEQDKKDKPDQQKEDQQKQQQPDDKQKEQEQQQAQSPAAQTNNFDKIRAAVLLDNLREDEKNWNFFPELQMNLKDRKEPDKDW